VFNKNEIGMVDDNILERWSNYYQSLQTNIASQTECCDSKVVVEIMVRIGWPFFEDKTFYRLLIAIPLKMYSKIG